VNRVVPLLAGLLLSAAALTASGADVDVVHAWIRWLPGDLPAGGYATIENHGDKPIRLLGADSTDYGMVMLHRSIQHNGIERMESINGMEVPAHTSAALAPGGYHLMLMHSRHAIAPGDRVRLRLRFADGTSVESDFIVHPATAQGDSG
jgi:hypothetical protein